MEAEIKVESHYTSKGLDPYITTFSAVNTACLFIKSMMGYDRICSHYIVTGPGWKCIVRKREYAA